MSEQIERAFAIEGEVVGNEQPKMTEHQRFAHDLREMASFVEAHPELICPMKQTFYVFPAIEEVAKYAKSLGKAKKEVQEDSWFNLVKDFATAAEIQYSWGRDQVCEKVVIGTVEVEEPVMVQQGTRTVQKQQIEWRCPRILKPELEAGA